MPDLQALATEMSTLQATLAVQEDIQRSLSAQADATRTRLEAVKAQINALLTAPAVPTEPV